MAKRSRRDREPNTFGQILRSRRANTINPYEGVPYTQAALAEQVSRYLELREQPPVTSMYIAAIEQGNVKQPHPEYINAFAKVLSSLTVTESCKALGYDVEETTDDSLAPPELELVRLFRRLPPEHQTLVLGAARQAVQLVADRDPRNPHT